ncbi:hypothetical protein EHI52_05560 [Mesomycoplasma hyopneumoniae]|nr:hypothetical protein [Mesomycoplasma hyopneumoniae]QEA02730.1 hypothetical protein EHI52_05560 [Mesomycoplasma hyopneumoniae]
MNFNFKNVKKVEVVVDNEQGELIEKLKLTSISEVKRIILTD